MWGLALLLVLSLALPLAAAYVDARRVALALLALGVLGLVAVLVGTLTVGLWLPRRRYAADAPVARLVGAARPELASDLLSCVELGAPAADPRQVTSRDLVDALVRATEARLATVTPATIVPRTPVRRAARAVIALVLLHGLSLALAPSTLALGWKTLVVPPARPFGNAELVAAPLLADLEVDVTPPAYARREPLHLRSAAGEFRALAGSAVVLSGTAAPTAVRVELVLEVPGRPRQTIPLAEGDDGRWRGGFGVTEAATYRFATIDRHGHRAIEEVARVVDLEADAAPTLQLVAPADDLDVTHLRQIELAYVVDDDLGVRELALVWQAAAEAGRTEIALPPEAPRHAEGKLVWDLATLTLPPGARVTYWLEATDNDDVGEPQRATSRQFRLHVFSPREQHLARLDEQRALIELMLVDLAARLPGLGDELAERATAQQRSREVLAAVTALAAGYAQDPHAAKALREAVGALRDRLDKPVTAEQRVLERVPRGQPAAARGLAGKLAASDAKIIAELEAGILLLADWLDREQVEGMLDIADEIAGSQARLAELLAEAARSGDPAAVAAAMRQLRALEQSLADLAAQRRGLPEDVLDRFINPDAARAQASPGGCVAEVRALLEAGKHAEAQTKLTACQGEMAALSTGLEQSLDGLRGDRFGDEQRQLDEARAELEDLAQEQEDIAAEAGRIFDRYAARVDEAARAQGEDTGPKVAALIAAIRAQLAEVPGAGLTPFSTEELEIVDRRLDDVERMNRAGDLAEAQAMARQAQGSLDTIATELEAALEDEPTSRWADDTRAAQAEIERTQPLVTELITLLERATPSAEQLLSADDRAALDRLRKRQAGNAERAQKLVEQAQRGAAALPGGAGGELERGVGQAKDQMRGAEGRMKASDPGGARQGARAAADALGKTRERLRGAARGRQAGASAEDDEPIKIPGADAYRAPERFREDLLEAMKRANPDGYQEQIRRYYEDLVR